MVKPAQIRVHCMQNIENSFGIYQIDDGYEGG